MIHMDLGNTATDPGFVDCGEKENNISLVRTFMGTLVNALEGTLVKYVVGTLVETLTETLVEYNKSYAIRVYLYFVSNMYWEFLITVETF